MSDTLTTETTETTTTAPIETTEASTDSPQSIDDVWSTSLTPSTTTEPTAQAERAESDAPNPSDVSPSAESAEEQEEVATEEDSEVKEEETDSLKDEDITDDDRAKLPNVARRKLRYLEKVTESVIEPFRDTETPITAFFDALRDINPNRAEELVNTIAVGSAQSHPDEWLKVILGDESLTVEAVKTALSTPQTPPTAPIPDDLILQKVVNELDEVYGKEWRTDDSLVLEEDLEFVNKVRAQLDNQTQTKQAESEEIAKLKAEIAEYKPQIEQVLTEQEQAHQNAITSKYSEWSTEYEKTIENAVLPSIIKANGLEDNPNDSEKVKSAKAEARARFEDKTYGVSDFERFLLQGFSQKDNLTKILNRVGKNLNAAAIAEVNAGKEKDNSKAEQMRKDAQSLRNDAQSDQDVITVLTKNASKEFLKTSGSATMSLLEEITQLRQQIAQLTGGRTELVGQAVTGGNGFKGQIESIAKEGKDPFSFDMSEIFAQGSR